MKKFWLVALLATVTSLLIPGADWPMQSGSPQRSGWAKSEHRLTKSNVNSLSLLFKYRADNQARGLSSLTAPIIDGNLITYRGFKEMLIFGASSDKVFSVDADLDKLLWQAQFNTQGDKGQTQAPTPVCPGGLTAPVIMAGSSSASMHFAVDAAHAPAAARAMLPRPLRPSPYFPPLSQSIYPLRPTTFTELAAVYAISSDGDLHIVNSSTGQDLIAPIKFLPPNSKVTAVNIHDNTVYATTSGDCDGYQNALYAIDLMNTSKPGASFGVRFGGFAGTGGSSIGNDGTVYVQAAYGSGDSMKNYHETVLALRAKTLQVKDYFTLPGKAVNQKSVAAPGITPMVFSWKGRDLILAGGGDGRMYVLDSRSLGGADHRKPMFEGDPVASRSKDYDGNGFRGTFSSWQDVDTQNRWIYVPLAGPPDKSTELPSVDGEPAGGSVAAFKINGSDAQPALQPLWVSREITSPAPPVIANGIVFALSTGTPARIAKKNGEHYTVAEWQAMATHATLYALDALTGKQLYSSGDAVPGFSTTGGLAVANGRVYFATHDNTVYCFGLMKEQPQLAEHN